MLIFDNIFTNDIDHEIKSGNLVTDLSDHFPNFVSSKGTHLGTQIKPIIKTSRQLKANNIIDFKTSLALVNWDSIINEDDPDNSYKKFINKTTQLLNPLPFKEY